MQLALQNVNLTLDYRRALFIDAFKMLIISDSHFGQVGQVQNAGQTMNIDPLEQDIERMKQLISEYGPKQVVFVGDLFDQNPNNAVRVFFTLMQELSFVSFVLVQGKGDMMDAGIYSSIGIQVVPILEQGLFVLVNDVSTIAQTDPSKYYISGYLHPGVLISGKGTNQAQLPCFYMGTTYSILPAFGSLTGLQIINGTPQDTIVFILEDELVLM